MKKLILLCTCIPIYIQAYITHVSLWQHKNNPQKNIVLVSDYHQEVYKIDIIQMTIINELFAYSYQLTQPIDILIELNEDQIKWIFNNRPKTYTQLLINRIQDCFGAPYIVDNMIISTAYFLFNKKQYNTSMIKAYPCDIKNNLDAMILNSASQLYTSHSCIPGSSFQTDKQRAASAKNNIFYTFTTKDHILALQSTSSISKQITISDYLFRIGELEQIIDQHVRTSSFSRAQKKALHEEFITYKQSMLNTLTKYADDITDSFITLLIHIYTKESDPITRGKAYDSLGDIINFARNICILISILESQKIHNYSVAYTGGLHSLWLEEQLPDLGYQCAYEIPIIIDTTCYENSYYSHLKSPDIIKQELHTMWELMNR